MVNKTRPNNRMQKKTAKEPARGEQNLDVERQIKIQKALYEIADAASAVTDLQEFYRKLHEIVGKLMHAKSFYVTLYDETTGILSSPYFADESGDEPAPPTKIDEGNKSLRAHVLLEGKTLHVSGTEIEQGRLQGRFEPMGTPAEDWIGVPLKTNGQIMGSLTVQSYRKGIQYGETDVQVLEFVAQHIAVALTRARAIDETRQRNAELAIINSVQEGLASSLDIQSIYTLVGDKIREKFEADTTFIVFRDEERDLLQVPYYADRTLRRSFSRPYGHGVAETIINSGKPLLLENARDQQRYGAHHVSSPGAVEDLNQSVLGVPILRDGKACGAVSVQSYKINAFDENDLRLLQTLTNSMSVALENARLFDEIQQSNAELQIINSVQKGLASRLNMHEIYELVGEKIRVTFNAQVVNIATYDPAAQSMRGRYYFEDGKQQAGLTLPLFGFRKHVIENRKPLLINKDMPRWMEEYRNPVVQGLQPKSAIFIPMLVGEEATGVISLQNNDHESAFTEADVRLLVTLSSSMSVALENARLFGETQRLLKETEQRNAELAIINSVQAGLASQLDIQSIYELVGDKIREIFDANTVALATFDLQKGLMHRRYIIERGEKFSLDPTPIPPIWAGFIQQGQSTLINNNMAEFMGRIDPAFEIPVGEMPKCALSVPLRIQGETRGVISLQNVDRENAFGESDMRLLETLANSMSVALENARLWEQEKLYRKALERELEIGREIQTGFLPEELPAVEGWEIAASLLPAREVAGDFYDSFELPDGNIGLVIADVCDKGVGAALFMTLFRSLIRITANQDYFEHTEEAGASFFRAEHLQRAMMLTNNYIAETHHASGMFATLFFGILEPHTGRLMYINGGHEPPLIVRSGRVRNSLCKTGPAVGAIPGCHFDVQIVQLEPGEMLFAFTDGAPEAKDPQGEFFGHERLFHILRQGSNSSEELVRIIEAELHRYMDGATQFDDITLLAVRRVR